VCVGVLSLCGGVGGCFGVVLVGWIASLRSQRRVLGIGAAEIGNG
jgi:hypothetical protein